MKLGIICSSGGSFLFRALHLFKKKNLKITVITDRDCKIINKCKKKKIFVKKISYDKKFEDKAKKIFEKRGVKIVLLSFVKIVSSKIYKNFQTFNIHPSWLPKYRGLNALINQIKKNEKYIGATLHVVSSVVDGGAVLFKVKNKYSKFNYKNISYIQKTYLCLILLQYINNQKIDIKKIDKLKFFKKIDNKIVKNNIPL